MDVAWPEGKLLLAVDSNEAGKTTLCEAVVAALYGFPRGRGSSVRPRDLRRPRSGAPFEVALDVESEGVRWSVERDLSAGTLRIVDRDRGEELTSEFLRSGGRDVFGERVTGGLTEMLFRATAYVGQNVLDRDELDSSLTVELARIADAGGGEASVMRALKSLDAARLRMPDPLTGPTVSVDTEVTRAERMVVELEAEVERRGRALALAAEASIRREKAAASLDAARRAAALADAAVDESDRLVLARQLSDFEEGERIRRDLQQEADRLHEEAGALPVELLARIDRLREERGQRPDSLEQAERALEQDRAAAAEEETSRARRLGEAAALPAEARDRLRRALDSVVESEAEATTAEEELSAQWAELAREGLADDIRRLELLPVEERDFLGGAEESRQAMEISGVLCDRKRADARHLLTIVLAERKVRVAGGRRLVVAAGASALVTLLLAVAGRAVPTHWVAGGMAFAFALGVAGAVLWERARHHRKDEERRASLEEEQCHREGERIRKELSDLRLRLDRVARRAGFPDAGALVRSHRRSRQAEEKRRILIARGARRDAAAVRRRQLETEIEPFRSILGSSAGLPSAADARKSLALLEDVERAFHTAAVRREALARDAERLAAEREALVALEAALREAMAEAGMPSRLPLAEAFLLVEAARRRAGRRREIVEVELPARRPGMSEEEAGGLRIRIAALEAAVARKLSDAGTERSFLAAFLHPEEARSAATAARDTARLAEEEVAAADRELAARAREGAERAREASESLAVARATLDRARLFRGAIDLAREALSASASGAYGDFRQGLHEASRRILAAWDLPYEALEFSDDLTVSARTRDGRSVTRAELVSSLSTGAREQLHLTARLAALEYLGSGARGVPLLLDDPLVGADDQRFRAVMRFLVDKVLPERPVLVVSCHGWRHERLLEGLERRLSDRIQKVSLSSVRTSPGRRDEPGPGRGPGLGPSVATGEDGR